MAKSKGILYIATGKEFVMEAEISARRVKKVMPKTKIDIASDIEPNSNCYDNWIEIQDPFYDFEDKIANLTKSRFEKTLFLDTDIYLHRKVDDIFELLNEFDIAVAHNQSRSIGSIDPKKVPNSFPEYNTGVLAYNNNDKFNEFANRWSKINKKIWPKGHDQPAFRKALYESDLRIATLRPEDNLMLRYPGYVAEEARILHGRLLDINTPGSGVKIKPKRLAEIINSSNGMRVYMDSEISKKEVKVLQKFDISKEEILYILVSKIKKKIKKYVR